MHIETERLILRNFRESDLDDLQAILGDAETMRNMEPPYTIEKTREFLLDFCIGQKKAFAAERISTGQMIGYVLFKPCGEPDVYEIAWIFRRDHWRQGYAYECCSALIRYALTEMNVHKIFAEAIDGVKSVGLMKKLGMQLEGIHRSETRDLDGSWADLYFYGILRKEYLRSHMQLLTGTPADIEPWMALVTRVRENFPGLETSEALEDHRQTVLRFMAENRALCVKICGKIAGVMLISRKHNMICCLAAAPEFRRLSIADMLLTEALAQLDPTCEISVTTFREEDPLGTAPRALYRKHGFLPDELTIDNNYPTQRFVLPAKV